MLNMSMVTDITREVQETEANLRSEIRFRKIVGKVAQEISGAKFEKLDISSDLSMNLEEINMELEKLFTNELAENRKKDALIKYQAKMATMGEMIGSIAHQWRQPLNTLKLVLMNLRDSSDDPKYEELCYDKANMLIKRMSETIDDFRYFSNPQTEARYFSIEESVNLVIGLVDEQLRVSGITLEVDCSSLPPIYGFDNQFSHVMFNIISNAIDALKQNPIGKPRVIRIDGQSKHSELVIKVEDSGPGIAKENSSKIFDMYFTTKDEDGGSGLGLAMASSILENTFNGKLRLIDSYGGCTFELKIPY
jgi:signal transduction histidine kinase